MTRFFGNIGLKKRKKSNATRVLFLFFFAAVLVGTLLLMLPIASRSGDSCGFLTALFTAAAAACVTGLTPLDTFTQWSGFGQAVLICLVQVGGLGYMAFVSIAYFMLRRKIGLRERLILQQSLALNELHGVVRLVKLMLMGTFMIEGIGAIILTLRFLVEYPFKKALWMGVFHAISAYCNAGLDIMGFIKPAGSLSPYASDPVVLLTIAALITIGGLGFFVWNDILMHRNFRQFSVHTKLSIVVTLILIVGGTLTFLLLEWDNPGTLGMMSVPEKLLAALFTSVSTRTAGFYIIDQSAMTDSSVVVSLLLMFIGGSSGSTAGGIKTVSIAILLLQALAVLRNHKEVVVFGRRISQNQINNALSISFLVFLLGMIGAVVISATGGVPMRYAIFESMSAISTAGLGAGITNSLNPLSKILLIVYMFFGRVGIMTISFAFMTKTPPDNVIHRPEARVLIG